MFSGEFRNDVYAWLDASGPSLARRRHPFWRMNRVRWQWLLDSYDGGHRYRDAVYGRDRRGLPVRNLVRHKREYPDPRESPGVSPGMIGVPSVSSDVAAFGGVGQLPGFLGADPAATAADDDYELRRSRTPVPGWVSDVIGIHLGKIYEQEVNRHPESNSELLKEWWQDVDGCGTSIDEWMQTTIAPLLLVLGQIDLLFDHPRAPDGVPILTRADQRLYGLDGCVASYILPENMVWWRLTPSGRDYAECLILEYIDPSKWSSPASGSLVDPMNEWMRIHSRLRHWTDEGWTLFSSDGSTIDEGTHSYGRVPIIRLIDEKDLRNPNCGRSRYEVIASLMREYYNRDSELILSDSLQAHPLLCGPEEYCKPDGTIPIGPNYLLPMRRDVNSGSYQGFQFISPPKDPAESLRKNKQDLLESKDAAAKLLKPAGAGAGSTVAQSGVSKRLDATDGNKFLGRIAQSLATAERRIAEMAMMVVTDGRFGPEEMGSIRISYSKRFDLFGLDELAKGISDFQGLLAGSGEAPLAEKMLIQALERLLLPGLGDEHYEALDAEVDSLMESRGMVAEGGISRMVRVRTVDRGLPDIGAKGESMPRRELAASAGAESDPTGQSGATAVTNSLGPSV